MTHRRKLLIDITVGTLLSGIFCTLQVYHIMAGGVGTSISFSEFLSAPENIISCLVVTSFVFAAWLMRGPNNRVVLFSWALVSVSFYSIYWWVYQFFYYQHINIYVLNLAGLMASLPSVIVLRYRLWWSVKLFGRLRQFGYFSKEIDNYLSRVTTTDFEYYMLKTFYLLFSVELLYGAYTSGYALWYSIPYSASMVEHFIQFKHWDPFDLYMLCLNIGTSLYIVIIGFFLFREHKNPDSFMYGVSDAEKRQQALALLQKRRQQHAKKQQPKDKEP